LILVGLHLTLIQHLESHHISASELGYHKSGSTDGRYYYY